MKVIKRFGGMHYVFTASSHSQVSMIVVSSEGVQVGGVRSVFGVLGSWTTVYHENLDPVGERICTMSTPLFLKSIFSRTFLATQGRI